jgi:hypothetical protein
MKLTIENNIERILRMCAQRARDSRFPIEILQQNDQNPGTLVHDAKQSSVAPVISLTTMSSRIDRVGRTLESIAKQTLKPHSVNLYISEEPYLLDKGIDRRSASISKLIDIGVNIYLTPNIGPYRKQYPIVRQLKNTGASPETLLITIDDDVLYPPDVVEQLVAAAGTNDAVVAHRGREIAFSGSQIAPYDSFRSPSATTGHLNLPTGRNGIAYRLKHFPDDPAEYVGPWLAPTADDIWCKWVTGIRCIPSSVIEPRAAYDKSLDFPESAPTDKHSLFHAFNANGTNDEAMLNMETFSLFHRGTNITMIYGGAK